MTDQGRGVSIDRLEVQSFKSIARITDFGLAEDGASADRGARPEPA